MVQVDFKVQPQNTLSRTFGKRKLISRKYDTQNANLKPLRITLILMLNLATEK